jgi:hypothetical protein
MKDMHADWTLIITGIDSNIDYAVVLDNMQCNQKLQGKWQQDHYKLCERTYEIKGLRWMGNNYISFIHMVLLHCPTKVSKVDQCIKQTVGENALCDTAVRTAGHFTRFTPDSDFFHHTFCTVHTVHSVCSHHYILLHSVLMLHSCS